MPLTAPPVVPPHIRELARVLHDLSRGIARLGPAQVGLVPLPATEVAVLRAVMAEPDRSVSEVAAALSMQTSNVSAAVRSLSERGLVDKRPSSHDGRVTLLRPTAKALKERDDIERAIAGTIYAALVGVSEGSVDALLRAVPAMEELTIEMSAQAAGRLPVSAP
jgi:DNA-binding MarR family transcriptional regulator